MKLRVKGFYSNPPANLFFAADTEVELDEAKALFVLRDAPDNFEVVADAPRKPVAPAVEVDDEDEDAVKDTALEKPPKDRAMRKARTK